LASLHSLGLDKAKFLELLASRSYSTGSNELLVAHFVLGHSAKTLVDEFGLNKRRVAHLLTSFKDVSLLDRLPLTFDFGLVDDATFRRAAAQRRLSDKSIRLARLVIYQGVNISDAQLEVGMRPRPLTRGVLILRTIKAAIAEQLLNAE
jgi:hypothetical protein